MDREKYLKLFNHYWPDQCIVGLESCLNLFIGLNPICYVEIGCRVGGLIAIFREFMKEGLIVGVDYQNYEEQWKEVLATNNEGHPVKTEIYLGDSIAPETVKQVKKALNGKLIDYLFIDGNHDYPYPLRDYELYSPFVRSGGVICFHDYDPSVGVGVAVHELMARGIPFTKITPSAIGTIYTVKP
jgi:cephalosporin hydroxylase